MSHHVTIPIAVDGLLRGQSTLHEARANRLIADVQEEVAVTSGVCPEEQMREEMNSGFVDRVNRVVDMTRLDGWKTLYKDLYTVDIVAYRIALNLGLRSGKPSLAFLHNTNHEDRAYTPLGVCSAEEFVASARVELRSHRDAIARELSEETVDRVVELTDKMGVDDTIEFLKSLLAVSTHLGPLEDSRAVSQSHLRWRIRRLRYNLADRITKICPRWERLEDPIDKQLPPGRSLKAFVGE